MAIRAARRKIVAGAEEFAGAIAKVIDWREHDGTVRYHGEVWSARSQDSLQAGDSVRILSRDRLTLIVASGPPVEA